MINRKHLLVFFFLFGFLEIVRAQPRQGMMAVEIALPSPAGDTIRLSGLKGKVVLVDFWASWCGPCRTANKGLTKLYPKYKDKGFEILAVSLDESDMAWKKAISKDKVTWPQVIDRGGAFNTPQNWNIGALPTTYLVDKQGRLVAMDLEKEELEKVLKELLDK